MPTADQNYANHRKFVPLYHFFVFPVLTLNLGWSIYCLVTAFSWGQVVAALTAFALIVLTLFARTFALRVQDRVIRLEMRLRLRELLPSALQGRVAEFTPRQLVALRFASDAELPSLAARVLEERINDANAIKKLIAQWEADHLRA
jgi:Family of unknown function (DUF6526)